MTRVTSLVIGAGFLGLPLAKKLAEHSQTIIVDNFVRSNYEDVSKDIPKDITVITGDATSENVMRTAFDRYRPDNIFIFCGRPVDKDGIHDYILEREILEGVSLTVSRCVEKFGTKNVFFASSCGVYGKNNTRSKIKESIVCNPETLSGESFYSVERFFTSLSNKLGFNFYALRYFNIIGDRKCLNPKEDPVSFIVNELKEGNPIVLCRPNETIDVLYVDDAVDATVSIFLKHFSSPATAHQEAINIGSGQPVKLSNVYKKIAKKLKVKTPPCVVGTEDKSYIVANITKLKGYGWSKKYSLDYCIETLTG